MDYLNKNVSINLKRIRKSKNMSLDAMAIETGLSKSLLGQIERGEANPTITTLGKIVSGLRVGFTELIGQPRSECYIIRKESITPLKKVSGNYANYAYFPFEDGRNFEIYTVEIEPGGCYKCNSHGEDTMEYIIVNSGVLTIEIDVENHTLKSGDAIRFYSDRPHNYRNSGDCVLRFSMLFTWS